ncbi:MAG: L-threonylcarbamoyladenylate synthase [Planctomycetota bacterium]
MATEVIRVDATRRDRQAIRRAADVLRNGGLVAFPTETVYGIGVRADLPAAVARLRDVKGRAAEKALTVHIGSPGAMRLYVPDPPGLAERFARKGWPGPVTLILDVPSSVTPPVLEGRNPATAGAIYYEQTVGLRCPDEATALALLGEVDAPVVASSANAAGEPPPRDAQEVLGGLQGRIDLLLDGGTTRFAKGSTIVRVRAAGYSMIREGVLDAGVVQRMAILRILFVCTGNTCRSPMAAGLARKLIAERLGCRAGDLTDRGILVESAGTSGGLGGAATNAKAVMARRGVDLSDHSAATLSADLLGQADYVFVMTQAHLKTVERLAPANSDRVAMLLNDDDVTDPFGGSEEDYERCAAVLERGLRERLREVVL